MRWHALIDYHLRAVRQQSVVEPPRVDDRSAWITLALDREEMVTGRGDTVPLDERIRRFVAVGDHDDVVHYGWPLVVAPDRHGGLRVAPLFITELATPAPDGDVLVPVDDEPGLNPSLVSDEYFPADAVAAAHAVVADGWGFGDAATVVRTAGAVAATLGLPLVSELDPDRPHASGRPVHGVHAVAVLVRGPSQLATRGLITELSELRSRSDWQNTAAAWLVQSVDDPPPAPFGHPASLSGGHRAGSLPPAAFEGLHLNHSQEQAVASALEWPLTVVTGPPGTGKSQLVASLVGNQWLAGRTVLVASTNNGAVDVAAARCARLDEALLVRGGNSDRWNELPAYLETLAARGTSTRTSPGLIRRQLEIAATTRAAVLERFERRSALEMALEQQLLDVEVLRAAIWGAREIPRSVTERLRELESLAAKLTGSRWWKARRRRHLVALARPTSAAATVDDVLAWLAAETAVARLLEASDAAGPADSEQDRADLYAADAAWATAGTAALRDLVQTRLDSGRAALQHLARIRKGSRDARVQAVRRALGAAPAWACTALSARQNFPLSAGLFDLLVVDEASQCSIAHVLPLAYRARRIVVVGDPNQLTPVVTLDRRVQERIARSTGWTTAEARRQALSVGHDSAYTAFAARSPEAIHLLEEHYRCHPSIAGFFNEQFYAGALRVLTDVGPDDGRTRGLHLIDVRGETRRGPRGGACNQAEAEAVARWIMEHAAESGSIGVVTPFSAQGELVRSRLRQALGPEAAEHVRVGTSHRFQGDECDVVLFSTVLSSGVALGTARWVEEQRNLVNVAVSRARRALVVVADTEALPTVPVPTLHALVELALLGDTATTADASAMLGETSGLHSEAERRLFAALSRAGSEPRVKVVVEGYELDLAVDLPSGPVDIEVDGVQHVDVRGRQRRQDLARDHVLERLGWRVVRVPAWRALAEPERAAADLLAGVGAGLLGVRAGQR